MVHSRKGVHVTNGTLQNGTALQNGTGSKWYIVVNRYMLKNGTLQNGTVTKRYTDILVCYITVFYSHNQQGLAGR
jgi:hypothetical protein